MKHPLLWACPNCQQPLVREANSLLCPVGHCFDLAREGYVNLHNVNRKRSREPGDNREMVDARRRVHQADIYLPLAEAIAQRLGAACPAGGSLLDLGCGEGYYAGVVLNHLSGLSLYGVDIAKPAVRLAAKACPAGQFAVASASAVPLVDRGLDAVLSVFAPVAEGELARLLKSGGHYLKVTPAPGHLWELRELLYSDPRPHAVEDQTPEGFMTEYVETLEFRANLRGSLLQDLVTMTPYAYGGQRENRELLLTRDQLSVQMAFTLTLARNGLAAAAVD